MLDNDMFQIVVLALLAAGVVLGLLTLAALSKLRRAVEGDGGGGRAGTLGAASDRPAEAGTGWGAPAPGAGGWTGTGTETYPAAAAEPTGGGRPAGYGAPPAGVAATVPAGTISGYGAPPATYAGTAGGAAATTPGPAATAEPEPQDEPFERGGRWWFRRGDELLVYDEATGQWQAAAPDQAAAAGLSGGPSLQPAGGMPGAAGGEPGGAWKCPTCGAVNGSTATSCRMCFTART